MKRKLFFSKGKMDFKMLFYSYLFVLFSGPHPSLGQTGSSFFYYYSPKQPMLLNSQTFGSNPQSSFHQASNPADFFQQIGPNQQGRQSQNAQNAQNPSFFNHAFPSQAQNLNSQTFPNQNSQTPYYANSGSSLLDKIAFTNAPTPAPPTQSAYTFTNTGNDASFPTSSFPGRFALPPGNPDVPGRSQSQTQPSPKLFNFLNQPFQFFNNHFNRLQPLQNQHQEEPSTFQMEQHSVHPAPPQPSPEVPSGISTFPSATSGSPSQGENSRQNFYTYYDRTAGIQSPKTTPLTFSVNQYFTTKTTKGPASYTFTIEANPTAGPTAMVQVSLGGDALPSTFPTLSPSLFHRPKEDAGRGRDDPTPIGIGKEEKVSTFPKTEEEMEVKVETLTTTPGPTPSTTTTTETSTAPVSSTLSLSLELVPPSEEASDVNLNLTPSSTTPSTVSTFAPSSTTPTPPTSTTTTTTAQPSPLPVPENQEDQEDHGVRRKPVKRVILVRKRLIGGRGGKRIRVQGSKFRTEEKDANRPQDLTIPEKHDSLPFPSSSSSPEPEAPTAPPAAPQTPPTPTLPPLTLTATELILPKRPESRFRASTTLPLPSTTSTPEDSFLTPTTFRPHQVKVDLSNYQVTSTSAPPTTEGSLSPTTFRNFLNKDEFSEPLTTTASYFIPTTEEPSTSTLSLKPVNPGPDANNDEYEYYYYDDNANDKNSTETENLKSEPSSSTTEEPSTTTLSPSTTTISPPTTATTTTPTSHPPSHEYESNYYDYDYNEPSGNLTEMRMTTLSPLILEEEEIEPLSTTEASMSIASTTSTTTTTAEISISPISTESDASSSSTTEPSSTEAYVHMTATTKAHLTLEVTTFKPSNLDLKLAAREEKKGDDKPSKEEAKEDGEVATMTPTSGSGLDGEAGQGHGLTGNETGQLNETETVINGTVSISSSVSSSNDPSPLDPYDPDHYGDDYPLYPEVEADPFEEERLQEAQRQALQTALKNLRIRHNASSTTEKPEEENPDQPKFVRRPSRVNITFPSSVSVSISSNLEEDDDLGDRRTNIIRKINSFKTKLRKVVNRVKATTTKKPRRVTRPSEIPPVSSTNEAKEELELSVSNETMPTSATTAITTTTTSTTTSATTTTTSTTTTSPTTSTTPTTTTTSTTTTSPTTATSPKTRKRLRTSTTSTTTTTTEAPITSPASELNETLPVTPPGSLIITEILPSSSTTESMTSADPNHDPDSPDFDTEPDPDSEVKPRSSSTTSSPAPEEPESSTLISLSGQSESMAETSTFRTVRERVKIIKKKRKDTGEVIRVVRTRTRTRPKPQYA